MRLRLFIALLSLAGPARAEDLARIKVLGFNDFHGQLDPGRELDGRPVGSAAVLAAYLRAAAQESSALIVHAGDFVGGSPFSSALLQDEPSIEFLNLLGNEYCRGQGDVRCNVVGTLGNHEFDDGVPELLRLLRGGNAREGPFLSDPYRGALVPYVCANVLGPKGVPLLAPYVVRRVGGVSVGIVGAVLKSTENIVLREGLRGARFIEESESINRAVRSIQKRGVRAIVVIIHQGAGMIPYVGATRRDVSLPESDIAQIVSELDPEVDVVVSGHAHQFTNVYARTARGGEILVTQAYSAGMAYSEIDLTIDRGSGDVVEKSARIELTYADAGPGLNPASDVLALTARAQERARSILNEVVGRAPTTLRDAPTRAGESALGNWVADAQRLATQSDVAFVNRGTLRGDLPEGAVTLAMLLSVQPFGSTLLTMKLSGAQLRRVLETQWEFDPPHILQLSGITYRYDASLPPGKRVVSVRIGDQPIHDERLYRVTVSDYLARGGGGFPVFAEGTERVVGPRDIAALRALIARDGGLVRARVEARIVRRE